MYLINALITDDSNSESMNHQLKLELQWEAKKTPDLVNALHKKCKSQYHMVRAALHGTGDFALVENLRKTYYRSEARWLAMSADEKNIHFQNFLKNAKSEPVLVHATKGGLVVPSKPAIAQKKNQRKRSRAARTITKK